MIFANLYSKTIKAFILFYSEIIKFVFHRKFIFADRAALQRDFIPFCYSPFLLCFILVLEHSGLNNILWNLYSDDDYVLSEHHLLIVENIKDPEDRLW